jgi:hypothetical protein
MNKLDKYLGYINLFSKTDLAIYDVLKAIKTNQAFDLGVLYSSIDKTNKIEVLIFEIISNNDRTKIPILRGAIDKTVSKNVALLEVLEDSVEVLEIGSQYQGGTVLLLNETGKHGLIVANEDASILPVVWGINSDIPAANNTAIYTGLINTLAIIANAGIQTAFPNGDYAAAKAKAYNAGGATDWYLPSKDELNLMYQLKASGKGFWDDDGLGSNYWSSTNQGGAAWVQLFYDYSIYPAGAQGTNLQSQPTNRTRAIRIF